MSGAAVTASLSGFINTHLFQQWLGFFAALVPSDVQRPLLLVLDGYASHYSRDVLDTAARLHILLVFLPLNATHLLQPLDAAVFATLKSKLRNLIDEFAEEGDDDSYSISKAAAIKLASLAWKASKFKNNVKKGFKACGLFPMSLVNMGAQLRHYECNGVLQHLRLAAWLQVKPIVEDSILTLPTPPKKPPNASGLPSAGAC